MYLLYNLIFDFFLLDKIGIYLYLEGKRTNLKDDSSSDEEFRPNQSDGSDDKPRTNKRKRKSVRKRGSSEEDEESVASIASSDESDVSFIQNCFSSKNDYDAFRMNQNPRENAVL